MFEDADGPWLGGKYWLEVALPNATFLFNPFEPDPRLAPNPFDRKDAPLLESITTESCPSDPNILGLCPLTPKRPFPESNPFLL